MPTKQAAAFKTMVSSQFPSPVVLVRRPIMDCREVLYAVWARYGGDTANASSTSTPSINIMITPEASTTTLAVDAYDRTTGQPVSATNMPLGTYVILDAQIEGKAEGVNTQGVATGNVTFTDGNPILSVAR